MATFNSHAALVNAVALVTAALQSKSINLRGPDVTGGNESNIAADVAYINGLINGIASNLSPE